MVTITTEASLQEGIKWYSDNDRHQSTTTENHKMGTIETIQAKRLFEDLDSNHLQKDQDQKSENGNLWRPRN